MPTRGMIATPSGNNLFIVVDDEVFKVSPTGARTQIGTLVTRRGTVGMKIGLTQLVIVDGVNGYLHNLTGDSLAVITSPGWLGSHTVDYIGGYFTFIDPDSQTFYVSAIEDASTIDALDFATANASPDKLVSQVSTGNVLVLLGEIGGEVWQESGAADFPLERNSGSYLEVGILAAHTLKEMDNSAFWLGRDERGAGMVYRMEGFRPTRISTMAIEQVIQAAIYAGEDVSKAVAYTYQQDGHSFYVLQVPGLDTTWTYDASSQMWHERAELVQGDYAQHRGRFHAYCYGKHLIAGDDGIIYEYDVEANDNAGDVLVRDRVSPHYATPSMDRLTFSRFELDCVVGYGKDLGAEAHVLLRYSNDGGFDWSSWRTAGLGGIGEKQARARFLRCGSARDRVWHVRVTDNVKFAIIAAVVEAK